MMVILIALRNLIRQRRRTFLLGGAIAFGITVATLINGVAGSFVGNASENSAQLLAGHIFVSGVERFADGRERNVIRDDAVLVASLEAADVPVRAVSRRSEFTAALMFQGQSVRQSVVGVDWEHEVFFRERLVLVDGSFDNMLRENIDGKRNGIILTSEIADRLNVQLDDRVVARLRTVDGQQNVGEFVVAAISHDPGLFGQLSAYADLSYVNELLLLPPGTYQTLGIFLDSLEQIDAAIGPFYDAVSGQVAVFERSTGEDEENVIEQMFAEDEGEEEWTGSRYRIFTLNDVLSEIDQIVDLLNNAALVILIVFFVIIMVGITNTFRVILYERIREIGAMRALGMQRPRLLVSFLLEAMFLGLAGAIVGLLVAGVIMFILSMINWGLGSPLFLFMKNGYMTFALLPSQVILNTTIVTVLTVLAALFPSRKAARLEPVDALRSI